MIKASNEQQKKGHPWKPEEKRDKAELRVLGWEASSYCHQWPEEPYFSTMRIVRVRPNYSRRRKGMGARGAVGVERKSRQLLGPIKKKTCRVPRRENRGREKGFKGSMFYWGLEMNPDIHKPWYAPTVRKNFRHPEHTPIVANV